MVLRHNKWKAAVMALMAMLLVVMSWACDREEYDPEASSVSADDSGEVRSANYSMRVDGATLEAGQESTVLLEITPGEDLKVNLEYPWSFEFEANDGVELAAKSARFADLDLNEERAIVPVEMRVDDAGEYQISATGDFSVCNDDICKIMRGESLEFAVTVQ